MKKYNPKAIESKWQRYWKSKKVFNVVDPDPKASADTRAYPSTKLGAGKYVLIEFPYPSGAGLHMGHMRPFIAGDVTAKYHKLKGFNTMYPIGWDAFGLPAENYAIKNKVHPEVSTKKNIANAKKQLLAWGTGFDWDREINTTDPTYYKWTQWIFLKLLKAGLAYEATGLINWCPKDKTGLANEEVVDGKCERCGTVVEKKELRQWYLKITDYAEKLLGGLKELPAWPEPIKLQQENWIGKSEGALIKFPIFNDQLSIEVFTTRADTLFGVTYVVLAPEHELIQKLKNQIQNFEEVLGYIEVVKNKSDIDRTSEGKEKTGVELKGIFAINPANNEKVPVWIADYVLASYGTGAIMAVPAHDERDFEFAKKYNLPFKQVVAPSIKVGGKYTPKEGVETLERRTVSVILENKEGSIAILTEPETVTLIGGGIEDGETPQEAALREIKEETGYIEVEIKDIVLENYFAHGYRYTKQKNTLTNDYIIHAVLKNEKQIKSEIDSNRHSIQWVKKAQVRKIIPAIHHHNQIFSLFEKPVFIEHGKLVNSGKFNDLSSQEAQEKITEFVGGKIVTKYKLRDWVFSRQRYWGEPIPVIHCSKHGVVPVPEKDLPVVLPKVKNYEPTGTGDSPLAAIDKWVNTKCPTCEEESKETKYLIFDFDGVIGDTWEVHLQTRINMGNSNTREEAIIKAHEYFDSKPWHHRGDHFGADEKIKHEEWSKKFADEMVKLKYDLFDDFVKEIKKIKNVKIAIVSAGSRRYSENKLKKSDIKYTHLLSMEDHHSKEEKIEQIAKDWKVDVKDVYYITDSKADVYELENLLDRKKLIGCAWGYSGEKKLAEVLPPNQILKNFKDIHNLFKQGIAKRETNTMPQWAGSSWYWLRYADPKNKKEFASEEKLKYWTPVDLYFGGMEHTTLHLLYSRFWNLFLADLGLVTAKEPYVERVPHGIILGPDGEKMSKSRGNVVNPDEIISLYGADTTRVYMMFLGPHGAQVAWNDKGIIGARRFIEKIHSLKDYLSNNEDKELTVLLHKTIKKIGMDISTYSFNTAISAMMIFVNLASEQKKITKSTLEKFLIILSPFAPHIAEEMWKELKHKNSIYKEAWPEFDPKLLISDTVRMVVQVNGKVRGEINAPTNATDEEIRESAQNDSKVMVYLKEGVVKKVIIVRGRIINFVV